MPFRGSFFIFLLGLFSKALSFGVSSPSLVSSTLFFVVGRALFFGYEGLFTIDILLYLASTSAMLAWGFLEMENIKSFD